jgi:excisionase family DNA binding protein
MDDSTALITTSQAAQLLGCSRQHVVDMCTRGLMPSVPVGSHRRVRRSDVTALTERELTKEQEQSLWLHRAIAGHLAADPDAVLARARKNVERLGEVHAGTMAARWLDEWRKIIDAGVDEVFGVLTSQAPRYAELRQNSPFAGVLPETERQKVLTAFREHRRREHVV